MRSALVWIVLVVGPAVSWGQSRRVAPPQTPLPSVKDAKSLRAAFVGLSDGDAAGREIARQALMGMDRGELPNLLKLCDELKPLEPGVVATLRDVVIHVHLAGTFPKTRDGFLGISMPALTGSAMEVTIESRLPGFAAFRHLQDGDAILDIEERPLTQPADREQFQDAIKALGPGRTIHLKVLRRGQVLRVPVQLAARPGDDGDPANDAAVQQTIYRRAQEAVKFWEETFLPVITDKRVERAGT